MDYKCKGLDGFAGTKRFGELLKEEYAIVVRKIYAEVP
jgi:hypothetical protein